MQKSKPARRIGGPVILFVILVMAIFLLSKTVNSEDSLVPRVIITEICPRGCAQKMDQQWVEIYNRTEEPVDIEEWKFLVNEEYDHNITTTTQTDTFIIDPGEYAVLARNDLEFRNIFPDYSGKLYDTTWSHSLSKEGNDAIGLKNDEDGDEKEFFIYKAISNYSLERKDPAELATDENNWQEHPDSNTVGLLNYWGIDSTDSDDDSTDNEDEDDGEDQTPNPDNQTPTTTIELKINEFLPNPDDGNEWIEIYNPTTSSVDLTGCELFDAVGKIAELTGTVDGLEFFVVELTSSKLNNTGGDSVILKNVSSTIIDNTSYTTVAKGNSIARSVDGIGDFVETTTLTRRSSNVITAPVVQQPTSSGGGGGGSVTPVSITFNSSDVVINEIVSDPSDGLVEFVELYNNTDSLIDLSAWWLEDGGESKTSLSGSIASHGFKIIENPSGNLNNAGDLIILFAPDGTEIDRVVYGSWDDGNINDNAVAPSDPLSLARKIDGQDSNNDYYDFVLTSTVTKGERNQISVVSEDGKIIEQIITSAKIVLNEILPNPNGSDSEDEFIELKNISKETINLKDWQLSDAGTRKYKITQGSISAGGYIVFKRTMTGIALNNTGGDEVKLYAPNGSLVDSVKYSGSADNDTSYARLDEGGWKWTTKLTAGKENIIVGKSVVPIVSIEADTEVAVGETVIFDASDTTDPDNEDMSFVWDFADGEEKSGLVVSHVFNNEGVFAVKLIVVDASQNEVEKKIIITVKNRLAFVGGYDGDNNIFKIKISEFIPNPVGSDTTEFIELYNPTDEEIDLSDFKLDDEEGGSRAYTFPAGTIISAGSYFVCGRQDSKLALNNTSDSVRLLYPDGTILQEVRFDEVLEGASYVQDENEVWQWTSAVTPGEPNIINAVVEKNKTQTVSKSKYIKPIIATTLAGLRDEDIGDQVTVSGVVAVEPGILGSQYFYITDSASSSSSGVQVYMYKKDFPDLKIGDRIEVTGEISEAYGETRIKISVRDDIKIIDHLGYPLFQTVEIADLQEPYEGCLIKINGEITELKSSYMFVDDGTEEIKVYFKRGAGIEQKLFQVGDLVSVVGLLGQTKSGYQLLPRAQSDVEKTGVAESFVTKVEIQDEQSKKEVAEKYLTATAGGLTSILFGLFAKARGRSTLNFLKRMSGVAVAVVRRKKV